MHPKMMTMMMMMMMVMMLVMMAYIMTSCQILFNAIFSSSAQAADL